MFYFLKKEKIYNFIFVFSLILSFVLLQPFRNTASTLSTPLSGKIIVIDAGHGHSDGGAIGYSGVSEKELNLSIAQKTGHYLQQLGAVVIYTRYDDSPIYLPNDKLDNIKNGKRRDMNTRRFIRDNSDADLFLSIHMNYYTDPKYKGAQVFYNNHNAGGKKLAMYIQDSFKNYLDSSNNRVAKDSSDIYILKDSHIPAVLIECGFISNAHEEQKLLTDDYQHSVAYAICGGVINYLQNT